MPKIPGVNHLAAVRAALEKAGFRILRQGKHIVMSDGIRILTIPRHNPVNAFTMGGIARDAGVVVFAYEAYTSEVRQKRCGWRLSVIRPAFVGWKDAFSSPGASTSENIAIEEWHGRPARETERHLYPCR